MIVKDVLYFPIELCWFVIYTILLWIALTIAGKVVAYQYDLVSSEEFWQLNPTDLVWGLALLVALYAIGGVFYLLKHKFTRDRVVYIPHHPQAVASPLPQEADPPSKRIYLYA